MPSSLAPRRSIPRRLCWLKKCVRNSTAMQSSVSKAWVSSNSLQRVLKSVFCTAWRYQVEPISRRRCAGSTFMKVVMPTALPLPLSTAANGSIDPAACRASRRSSSACMRSGAGTVVYQSRHSSPSATASIRSGQCFWANGSSLTRPLDKVTGSSHAICQASSCAPRRGQPGRGLAFAGLGKKPLAVGEAIGLEEKAEDQGAVGRGRLVLVAGGTPDELPGTAHALVVLQRAFQNVGLLQRRVLVQGHDGARRELEKRRGDAVVVRIEHLDLDAGKLGLLPGHVRHVQKARSELRVGVRPDVVVDDRAWRRRGHGFLLCKALAFYSAPRAIAPQATWSENRQRRVHLAVACRRETGC